ncbi:MAG: PLDc N-terminal domain-containing protein [Desulfobacterales bacterium]|nr:PLDc N-terminal domain-containing protein [Desulfobacterales bacterium]
MVFITIGLFFFILNCCAFIDIAFKEFGSRGRKILWFIVALVPFIGCVIYFLTGFWQGKKPSGIRTVDFE